MKKLTVALILLLALVCLFNKGFAFGEKVDNKTALEAISKTNQEIAQLKNQVKSLKSRIYYLKKKIKDQDSFLVDFSDEIYANEIRISELENIEVIMIDKRTGKEIR